MPLEPPSHTEVPRHRHGSIAWCGQASSNASTAFARGATIAEIGARPISYAIYPNGWRAPTFHAHSPNAKVKPVMTTGRENGSLIRCSLPPQWKRLLSDSWACQAATFTEVDGA